MSAVPVPPRPRGPARRPSTSRPRARPTARITPSAQPAPARPLTPAPKRAPSGQPLPMRPVGGKVDGTYDDGVDRGSGAYVIRPPRGAVGPMLQALPGAGVIAGPVAAPFAAASPLPAVQQREEAPRTGPFFAVVLTLTTLAAGGLLASTFVVAGLLLGERAPEPVDELVVVAPIEMRDEAWDDDERDEGVAEVSGPRERAPVPTPRGPAPPTSPVAVAASLSAAPPPGPAAGTVRVRLAPGTRARDLQVSCPGQPFRKRAGFAGGSASVDEVPDLPCEVRLIGSGTNAAFRFQGALDATCGVGTDGVSCR